jgi:hypothetical protein
MALKWTAGLYMQLECAKQDGRLEKPARILICGHDIRFGIQEMGPEDDIELNLLKCGNLNFSDLNI